MKPLKDSSIEIREVKSRKDLEQFIRFPHQLYRDNPYWVPLRISQERRTLSEKTNPAFEYSRARYWLVLREGEVVGRVAAIISAAHHKRWNQAYMRFGWLDFIDDPAVLAALMAQVEVWAREEGLTAVHGPLGFTDMDAAGMLVEGFEELGTLATLYNYPYYPRCLEQLGYQKDTDWLEYKIEAPASPDERIGKLAQLLMKRENLRLVQAQSRKEVLLYARQIFDLFSEGYRNLYGYVPLNERQIEYYTQQYLGFLDPEFVPLVVDHEGRLVAFGVTMPSLSRAMQRSRGRLFPFGFIHLLRAMKVNDRADLYLVVVKPEYQGKGINAILINHMSEVFIRHGIRWIESNPELENNLLVQGQWKHFNRRQHKRRRCYIKYLSN
jgi:GNAT superfamily N-acetyltransferase